MILRADEWQCERCGSWGEHDGSWHWTGEIMEHKCSDAHPQAGHFAARHVSHAELRTSLAQSESLRVAMERAVSAARAVEYHAMRAGAGVGYFTVADGRMTDLHGALAEYDRARAQEKAR